jgi:hypothetical protein
MRPFHTLMGAAGIAALAGCSSSTEIDLVHDKTAPSIELTKVDAPNDTSISFNVKVEDNLGIKQIHIALSGALGIVWDTVFNSAVTDIELARLLSVSRSIPPGSAVQVTAFAVDGASNKSTEDTLRMTVGNLPPADAFVTSPPTGTTAVIGKSIVISLSGKSALKVRSLGFRTAGSVVTVDSMLFSSPMSDSVALLDTLAIPSNAPVGPMTVTPFVIDSLGQRALGSSVTLNVQTAAGASSRPAIKVGLTSRIEVNDTIHIEATDPTGILTMGYEVRSAVGGAVESADSISSNGDLTSTLKTFQLKLTYTTFPKTVYVQAFARNSNGTRAYARDATGADRIDTVTVVAGVTKPLPQGGEVADALYHPRTDRIYLTNIERNRLEVFNLSDSSFKAPISVGSRPWGLTAWPRDRSGTMGDTLLVANSGGTNVSYVNLKATSSLFPSGREVYTYALPNIVLYSVSSIMSEAGFPITQRTMYDFSDRPQYIAATCKGGLSAGAPCQEVLIVYSTAPTLGQSLPFASKGSVRWENLTRRSSHYFFEQAIGQSQGKSDTLEVVRFAANGVGSDSVLLPAKQWAKSGTDSVLISVVVQLDKLALRDTTFVRNSGNFRRAIVGEGGPVFGSRALMYDATLGMQTTVSGTSYVLPTPAIDLGVSRAADVTDFIANSFARVKGVGINFDGALSAIRGDSTYLLDPTLRLQGLLQTSGGNAGFDFHPSAQGNGIGGTWCYAFAASSEPVIEIYETRHYQRISSIPVRDPIIGPIKVALRTGTGDIVLVGATLHGVVIVTLTNNFTSSCQ